MPATVRAAAARGLTGWSDADWNWHVDMLAAVRLRTVAELRAAGYVVIEGSNGLIITLDGRRIAGPGYGSGHTAERLGLWVPEGYPWEYVRESDASVADVRRALIAESTVVLADLPSVPVRGLTVPSGALPDLPDVPVRGRVGAAPDVAPAASAPHDEQGTPFPPRDQAAPGPTGAFPPRVGDVWLDGRGIRTVITTHDPARGEYCYRSADEGREYAVDWHDAQGRVATHGARNLDLVSLVERAGRPYAATPAAPAAEPAPALAAEPEAPSLSYGRPAGPPRPTAAQAIEQFRDLDTDAAMGLVRCGFELETQATEGLTHDDTESDDDAYDEARSEWVNEQFGRIPRVVREAMNDRSRDQVREALYEDAGDHVSAPTRGAEQVVRDRLDATSAGRLLEVGEDGSVSGFELRTKGALTAAQFAEAAKAVFRLDHRIDERCSFHVHVSLPGVKHTWGERMQMALTEYVLRHADRVPSSVRRRWATDDENTTKFFKPGVSQDKFSFVHAHTELRTWEFRCFGNVQNAEDGMTCLRLAVEALQFAYGVLAGRTQLLVDAWGLTHEGFYRLCEDAMANKRTLAEQYAASAAELYERAA